MSLLGSFLAKTIEAAVLMSRAEVGQTYMQGFVAPHVWTMVAGGHLNAISIEQLDQLLPEAQTRSTIKVIRVWSGTGTALYSTEASLIGLQIHSPDIESAFSGKIVSQIEYEGDDEDLFSSPLEFPLFEVYCPIYDEGGDRIVAVGEFYEVAAPFLREINRLKIWTWLVVGVTTGMVIGLLYVLADRASIQILDQQQRLKRLVSKARNLVSDNSRLMKATETAHIRAASSNEILLNQIGSDIHDGPIQLVSLLALQLSDDQDHMQAAKSPDGAENAPAQINPRELITLILAELRDISTGLVIPDLEDCQLREALSMAVDRHRQISGTDVKDEYETLPKSVPLHVRVCLFRVVQEALTNSFRHAGGVGQHVSADTRDGCIVVTVSDSGAAPIEAPFAAMSSGGAVGLGLTGLRHRLQSFGGTLEIFSDPGTGTRLVAKIPIRRGRSNLWSVVREP